MATVPVTLDAVPVNAVVWVVLSPNLIPVVSTDNATDASGVTPMPTFPLFAMANRVLSGVVSSLTTKLFPEPRFVMTTASLVAVAVLLITTASRVPVLLTVSAMSLLKVPEIVCG
jgi:hypothetical protein